MKMQIQLLKIIVDMLNQLSEDQLNDLMSKKARLKLEYPKKQDESQLMVMPINDICSKLDTLQSREDAYTFFGSLSITKNDLKNIAKHYDIPLASKDTNSILIDKIIENVIGSKLRFDALLNTNLNG